MQRPTRRRAAGAAATTLTACSLFAAATLPAAAMTVTFIRHAESQGNASGYIDTSTPGPHLTNDQVNQNGGPNGEQQAIDWANAQCPTAQCTEFDALYASTMIRTQETAAPFAAKRGLPVTVLGSFDPDNPQRNSGVQEISAGIFEGLPESEGIGRIGYILAPLAWTMGLQFIPIPGGENGLEFNERVTNASRGRGVGYHRHQWRRRDRRRGVLARRHHHDVDDDERRQPESASDRAASAEQHRHGGRGEERRRQLDVEGMGRPASRTRGLPDADVRQCA
ncbi:histidine phosphatase family protein [Mycolicibacterium peregrinum]|uniref:histidine phosphatase family protein n=1 Tax=Mycolicibacterium peregrinum TaxID=43304 RepID=UPI003AB09665